jgi:hypothetical protein
MAALRFVTFTRTNGASPLRINPELVSAFGEASGHHKGTTFITAGKGIFYVTESPKEVEEKLLGTPLEQVARTARED